MAISMAQRI